MHGRAHVCRVPSTDAHAAQSAARVLIHALNQCGPIPPPSDIEFLHVWLLLDVRTPGSVASLWVAQLCCETSLITSRHEGLPMVALEAMAHGVPVIAFDVGALAKLINNNINGFIVKGSDLDTFIEYLNQWFQKTTTEKSLIINNARQCIIENYSTQSVIPQVLDVYKTAIRKVG